MSGLDLADPDDSSDNLHVQISILILWDCSLSSATDTIKKAFSTIYDPFSSHYSV